MQIFLVVSCAFFDCVDHRLCEVRQFYLCPTCDPSLQDIDLYVPSGSEFYTEKIRSISTTLYIYSFNCWFLIFKSYFRTQIIAIQFVRFLIHIATRYNQAIQGEIILDIIQNYIYIILCIFKRLHVLNFISTRRRYINSLMRDTQCERFFKKP